MKKYIALLLVLVTLLTLTACGKKDKDGAMGNTTTAAPMVMPESALELLQTVWASYGEGDKFYAMGGNYNEDEALNNNVENAPGKQALDDDGLTTKLMVPADQVANIAEAASLMHGMMANNVTCGAYKMNPNADAKAFGDAVYTSITENHFLCGAPEAVFIAKLDNEYVVAVYGMQELLNTFEQKLKAAYPGAEVLHSKLIVG